MLPESSSVKVDKTQGEVLFRISKEDSANILALPNKVFYITRVFAVNNEDGNVVNSSSEEVVYTGYWENSVTKNSRSLSALVEEYAGRLKDAQNTINSQLMELARLRADAIRYAEQREQDRLTIEDLQRQIDELNERISVYESSAEYSGTVIDNNASTLIIQNADAMTPEQLKEQLDNLNKSY